MNRKPHVAVVGATGAVGIEMIKTLEKRSFPVGGFTLLASARSVGKKLRFRGEEIAAKDWTEKIYKPDILGKKSTLYKQPGYGPI